MALFSAPFGASAQSTFFELELGGELLWSDNASYAPRGLEQKDTVLTFDGDVFFRRTAGRLNLFGSAGFSAIEYLDDTQIDRVLPRADITAIFEVIDDFFFVEAGLLVTQTPLDVFGVRSGASSTVNKVTTSTVRLVPTFKGQLSENITYSFRSENTWDDSSQADAPAVDSGYFGRHTALLDRAAVPFGGFVSLDHNSTEYDDQSEPVLRDTVARIGLNYAVTPQLSIGVRGGHEKAEGIIAQVNDRFYGGQFDWRPTDRTTFNGYVEDRFFGNSWQLRFTHRMPRVAWDLTSARDISTYSDLLSTLPQTSNLSALIDAALITRVPNAIERARAVREVINATGLPNTLSGPVNLYTERVLVSNRTTATVTLLGIRNTLGVSAYYAQYRDLSSQVESIIAPDLSFDTNNRQRGIAMTYSLRVTGTATFNLSGDWNRTRGLDANAAAESTQQTYRAQLSRQLAPKTTASVGYRYLNFDSNVEADSRENAVFVAVSHRF